MIQHTLLDDIEPTDEQVLNKIGQLRDVKSKGLAIQMLTLNIPLVEALLQWICKRIRTGYVRIMQKNKKIFCLQRVLLGYIELEDE